MQSNSIHRILPPDHLLSAYAQGIFPMAPDKEATEIEWYTATKRGIIPMDKFHVSENVQRIIRQKKVRITANLAFEQVIRACADRENSWISEVIVQSYLSLHELRFAHSVEVWQEDELVGGLYGVALGAAFFGESMFKRKKEMDKIALYYCHQCLQKGGFELWDTQFYTTHLSQFGCIEITSASYSKRLKSAINKAAEWSVYGDYSLSDSNSNSN